MIKNVIFDLGGVLIDWNPRHLFKNVFDNEKDMTYFLDKVCTMSWNLLQDAGRSLKDGTIEKQKEFPEYHDEIAMYYGDWEKMLNGAFEENVSLFYKLNENYRVFSLTNWSPETFPIALESFDFLHAFEGIVVSGFEKMVKPESEIYRLLLSRYKLRAQECLFIDDNQSNIETARTLGFETIHYRKDTDLKSELLKRSIKID